MGDPSIWGWMRLEFSQFLAGVDYSETNIFFTLIILQYSGYLSMLVIFYIDYLLEGWVFNVCLSTEIFFFSWLVHYGNIDIEEPLDNNPYLSNL